MSPLKTLTWMPRIWAETSPGHWLETRRLAANRLPGKLITQVIMLYDYNFPH